MACMRHHCFVPTLRLASTKALMLLASWLALVRGVVGDGSAASGITSMMRRPWPSEPEAGLGRCRGFIFVALGKEAASSRAPSPFSQRHRSGFKVVQPRVCRPINSAYPTVLHTRCAPTARYIHWFAHNYTSLKFQVAALRVAVHPLASSVPGSAADFQA